MDSNHNAITKRYIQIAVSLLYNYIICLHGAPSWCLLLEGTLTNVNKIHWHISFMHAFRSLSCEKQSELSNVVPISW